MSFSSVIAVADHRWSYDGDLVDSINALNGTSTGIDFPTTPTCLGVSASARTNSTSDNISVSDSNDINLTALSKFYIGGWIQISSKQGPPTCIWKAGGTTNNRGIFTGVNNNNLVFQQDDGTTIVQNYSDFALSNSRNYYIGMKFDNGICTAYIDGVLQSSSDPSDGDTGSTTFPVHNAIDWGNIDSTVDIGGSTILIKALVNCLYNEWHTFSGSNIPTDTQIRQDLFEEKAFASTIITSGTEAAMQTSIDGEADSVGPDAECDLEIQAVTGDGDLTLSLDNRTFNSRASIHIRYLGTGTLTIRNTNGSNASIGSTPNGGTIVFSKPVNLTVTCKDASTGSVIEGVRIRLLDGSSNVVLSGLTNASGILTASYDYVTNTAVSGVARKGSSSPVYRQASVSGTINQNGLNIVALMIKDE